MSYGPVVLDDSSGKFVVTSKNVDASAVALQIAKDLAPASDPVPTPVVTPPASSVVSWKTLPHNDWTDATKVTLNGKSYFQESAEKPYSAQMSTNTTTPIFRGEVRNNELWSSAIGGNDTERAELDGTPNSYAKGTEFWFAYQFLIEAGAPQIATAGGNPGQGLAWGFVGQIHGDGSTNQSAVPWEFGIQDEFLSVRTQQGNQVEKTHWKSAAKLVRGQVYSVVVRIKITGKTDSTMTCWVDGVQVANSTGLTIGGADKSNYPKVGIYRGWQGDGYPPLAVQVANVEHGTASLLARVTSSPAWPTVK